MIVFDTNVLSELVRASPDHRVLKWAMAVSDDERRITTITIAESLSGIALMPHGRRRELLASLTDDVINGSFAGRVLDFDQSAAVAYAEISHVRKRNGRPVSFADAAIAAIARSRGAVVATRNVSDFEGCGIAVIDPWAA